MSLVVPLEEIFASGKGVLSSHPSWERVELGEVCTILNGFPFKSAQFNTSSGFPIIRIRDLGRNRTETFYNGEFPREYIVHNGDLLVGMDGIFRCCEWHGGKAGLNQRVCKITPNEQFLDRRFLLYALNGYLKAIEEATSSVTVGHLSSRDILRIPFPLPPLDEQHRLARKLDEVTNRVRTCTGRLERIPTILKRFRQSVLAAACSGRLTADWREENCDIDAASELIKDKTYSLAEYEGEMPTHPEKWEWTALGNYGRCSRGRFSIRPRNDPRYFNGTHPFIQIGNLPPDGGLIRSHEQTLNDDGLKVSKRFPKGTAVIAIVGATIGNTGLLAYDMCFPDSMVGIETGTDAGNRYVEFFLRSKKFEIRQASYSSGGQPNIKLEFLNPYPLALAPLAEQQEIVRRVESLFTLADQLEARYRKGKAYVDKLTQSILAKAFRGELVPQDPNDEPAEKLLERIRGEKQTGNRSGQSV